MIKKIFIIIFCLSIILNLSSCGQAYKKYNDEYINLFNTYTTFTCYAKNEKEFKNYSNYLYEKLNELNKLFDIYNNYENINNLKTINDNAGIKPVVVDKNIINLLVYSKKAYYETNGTVNIAMGSVLKIWHNYREKGIEFPDKAEIPPIDSLKAANKYTDIENIIIDEENSTVFITNSNTSIDVGAIAKGYSCEIAVKELLSKGVTSAILNLGGNVYSIGVPYNSNRDKWGIGIQNPELSENGANTLIDTIFVNDSSIVSSGDYQRYYIVNDKKYHHIIDKDTLMPSDKFKSVTVIYNDCSVADMLSTALFILSYEEGLELVQKYNADAIWIFKDNSIKVTDGYKTFSKMYSNL